MKHPGSIELTTIVLAMLDYRRLVFHRSLKLSASYQVLSVITRHDFMSNHGIVDIPHFPPTVRKFITQQDYEIPASEITPVYVVWCFQS